jgi:hypothetical protein
MVELLLSFVEWRTDTLEARNCCFSRQFYSHDIWKDESLTEYLRKPQTFLQQSPRVGSISEIDSSHGHLKLCYGYHKSHSAKWCCPHGLCSSTARQKTADVHPLKEQNSSTRFQSAGQLLWSDSETTAAAGNLLFTWTKGRIQKFHQLKSKNWLIHSYLGTKAVT